MCASLIGRLRSSAFRLSTTPVSMSLAGSCFSSDSAPRPFQYGIRRRGGTIFRSALPSDQRQAALVASISDPKVFRSGRDLSAWIGLVPTQQSSGGNDRLGSISKPGDRYLRSLFTAGALAVIRYAKIYGTKHRPWLTALSARRPTKVAAIALANKLARMAWAMMTRGERYKEPV